MNIEPEQNDNSIDSSKYIRTYAQDLASLSGKKIVDKKVDEPVTKTPKKLEPLLEQTFVAPQETLIISGSKATEDIDLSALEKEAEKISDEQLKNVTPPSDGQEIPEPINLPKIDPNDIVPTKHKFTFLRKENDNDFKNAYSVPLVQPTTVPKENTDDNRDVILARLKARIASDNEPEKTIVIPTEPLPVPVPEIVIPIPPPAPVIEPVALPQPSTFHSFSTDLADQIDEKKASTFTVLAAQKDAAPVRKQKTHKSNMFLPVGIAVLLIILGSAGIYGAYRYMNSAAPVVQVAPIQTLVSSNTTVTLSGSGVPLQEALALQSTKTIPENSITVTLLGSTPNSAPDTSGNFFTALQLPAPDILSRNIDPSSSVGIINAGGETRPFFVLRVLSYERTFAGMLAWENTIDSDLNIFYPLYPAQVISSATSVSTSSPASSHIAQPEPATEFVDEIINNHDARALKDTSGNTLIVYGYADKQTLIIARNEAAFSTLLDRLSKQ